MAFLIPLLLGSATAGSAQPSVYQAPGYQAPRYQPGFQSPVYRPYAPPPSYAAQHASTYPVGYALNDWRRLRQSSGYSFADYARFLIANPDWPDESKMRRWAERSMRGGESPATVLAFFASEKPTTGNGFAGFAHALSASGRAAEALAAARQAWGSADLGASQEQLLYARFGGSFTFSDHDRRADALLFDKQASNAERFLPMTSATRRAAFAARIAMQKRSPNVEPLYNAVAGMVTRDAGLMMDRARYLRAAGWESAARQLAARQHSFAYKPADPDRFLEMLLALADGAAKSGQWSNAYNIARQVDDAFAPGTVMAEQPIGIRDKYTSIAWLGGTAAWSGLGRPSDAVAMFERYSRGGRSLQVLSKGLYWAGRAAIAARQLPLAMSYFQRAAAYPELFYGQLALERTGRSVPTPGQLPTYAVNPQQSAAFANRRVVQATRMLGQYNRWSEQTLFVRALAESLNNDGERVLATQFGNQIGRQDLAVWVARSARNKGSAFYVASAYPRLPTEIGGARMWSLAHGITRQESSFDRAAVSHAGARGMMQLMPGTAREQAGKMGMGYDAWRLTSDPRYNVMLGTAYFQRLLNMWDQNVPLAVASYNAGYGNVRKWVKAYGDPRRTDVVQWIEQIPFSETKGYVQRVVENSVVYDRLNPATPSQTVHVSRYLGKAAPG